MLKIETEGHIVKHLEMRGQITTVCSEISYAVALLYAKLRETDPELAEVFKSTVLGGMSSEKFSMLLDKDIIDMMLLRPLKKDPKMRALFDNFVTDVTAG